MATLAFLGQAHDAELARAYTQITQKDVMKRRGGVGDVFGLVGDQHRFGIGREVGGKARHHIGPALRWSAQFWHHVRLHPPQGAVAGQRGMEIAMTLHLRHQRDGDQRP